MTKLTTITVVTDDDCVIALATQAGAEAVQRIAADPADDAAQPIAGERLQRFRHRLDAEEQQAEPAQQRQQPAIIAPPPVQRVRSACSCESRRQAAQRAAEEAA